MSADLHHHGGALDAARRLFPDAPRPWLDLSTGINPVAYPYGPPPAEVWARLPEAEALAACEAAAARRYRVPPGMETVAAPGTQSVIARLPALCGGTTGADVRIVAPTYGEFERVFREAGARVRPVAWPADLAGADVAVLVNPNNPDGRLAEPDELLRLAARVGMLVVDEAFVDALPPEASVLPWLSQGGMSAARTIVLRSFGKVYGLAGLRLGFAVLPAPRAATLRAMLGPWAVSGPALAVGTQALADDGWLAEMRERLREDGGRLGRILRKIGATAVGGTPLFRLVAHPEAPALFPALAARGILVRPFADEPTWLRFGLPGRETDWSRLAEGLAGFRRGGAPRAMGR